MMTKFNFEVADDVLLAEINRLTNQIWKIIPMYENDEDWQKQLRAVEIDIAGMNELFCSLPAFLQALAKIEGLLLDKAVDFYIVRKTIFEVISLLQGMKKNESKGN